MELATLGNWYNGHTLLLDLIMITAVGAMSYQIALRSGVYAFISAGFWGVGAYAAGDIVVKTKVPWPVGVVLGMVISAVGGLLLSFLLKRLSGLYLGMATFAFDLVMGVIADHGGHLTGGASGLTPIPVKISVPMMLGIFIVVCVFTSRLEVGRLGRAQEVMHYDRELAVSVGTRVEAWRRWIFVLSAVVGGVSGSLYALSFFSVDPSQIGFTTLITGLTAVVVGGVATWRGCVIGALLVIGLPDLFQSLQIWEPVIFGGLLLLVAVFMPDGLFGLWRQRSQLFTRQRRRTDPSEGPSWDAATEPVASFVSAMSVPAVGDVSTNNEGEASA